MEEKQLFAADNSLPSTQTQKAVDRQHGEQCKEVVLDYRAVYIGIVVYHFLPPAKEITSFLSSVSPTYLHSQKKRKK
jgi:hypothetical protein